MTEFNDKLSELYKSLARANIYYDDWSTPAEPEEVIYVVPYERKSKEPAYKPTGKFPKIDEAIAAAKKFKK